MEESWKRNHGRGIMKEASGRHLEASGSHLAAIWRHLGASEETSGGVWRRTQRRQEAPGVTRGVLEENVPNHMFFLSKVARPTISHESGEGDPHDLRSLRTKVIRNSSPRNPDRTTGPLH